MYEEALALQREAGDIQSVAIYLSNLGEVARDLGEHAAAVAYYREGLGLWADLKDRWNTAATLDGLAGLAAELRRPDAAVRLFGAAAAMRDAAGVPLPPNERAEHERYLGLAREALGEASFAAAWKAGQSLALEEAIAEGQVLADELIASAIGG